MDTMMAQLSDVMKGRNLSNQSESSGYDDVIFPGFDASRYIELAITWYTRMVICGIGTILNLIVLVIQIKEKTFLKTQSMFAFSLTISDLGQSVLIFYEVQLFRNNLFQENAFWLQALISGLHEQSYYSIIGVAVDRYLALCAIPFKYKLVVTFTKYVVIIACTYIISIGQATAFFYFYDITHLAHSYRSLIYPTLLAAVSMILYIRLSAWIFRSMKEMKLTADAQRRRNAQTKQVLKAFGIILATNALSLLPNRFFNIYIILQPEELRYNVFSDIILANWFYNIQTLNSCLNPIIYWKQVLLNKARFRSTSKKSMRRVHRLKKDQGGPNTGTSLSNISTPSVTSMNTAESNINSA